MHLHHPHDLMHKAVGWMLREVGKRVSMDLLREFLRQHAHEMPRTALRYAIEKMSEPERKQWLDQCRGLVKCHDVMKPSMPL
jgi:3-methyladenine DNA glycosylase AlkD